jgi:hypothetical protein
MGDGFEREPQAFYLGMKNPTCRENLWGFSALGGTRTPNLLIRSYVAIPLYEA